MIPYGILCGLAALVSLAAGRKPFIGALAVLACWGFYNSIWFEGGLGFRLWSALSPYGVGYVDIWAMTDLCLAALVLYLARTQWWGLAIWAVILIQMGFHVAHQFAGLGFSPYSVALDALFLGQLAVFFMLGGGSCVSLVLDWISDLRNVFHSPAPASRKEAE